MRQERVPSAHGTNRTSSDVRCLVAIGGKADLSVERPDFSL